jgi:hypothetical protein
MIHSLAYECRTEFADIEELKSSNPETRYTVFKCFDRSLVRIRQGADETLYNNCGWKCSHEHDCCGCWALIDLEVLQISSLLDSFMLVEHWSQNV